MRRSALAAALLLIVALPAIFTVGAPAVRADATASVTPGGGDLRTLFTFAVQGLQPGDGILIVLYDGAGSRFSYQNDGVDQVVVVDGGGNAAISMTPATDLRDAAPGPWMVVFTDEESGYSATVQFDVAP